MPNQASNSAITIAIKKYREDERVRDILLAVEQLFQREEKAVDFVLSCLYDIGSVNLINNKVPITLLKPALRSIARFSRPAFRLIAVRWFHQNCPQLITDWLHSLVVFKTSDSETSSAIDIKVLENDTDLAFAVQQKQNEVTQLQQQLRQTIVLAVMIVAMFGSATLWLGYELQQVRAASSSDLTSTLERD
ncbi:MAG: hypothetical protein HC795_08130 [Coleofasciculaceae cyanobacterium RL_1_1]|nr:hypothetical protein [Coleofasciculaceae cyanobacterium RL_1_1]